MDSQIEKLRMPLQDLANIVSRLRVRDTETIEQLDLLSPKGSASALI